MLSRMIQRGYTLSFDAGPGHNRIRLIVRLASRPWRDMIYMCSCEQGSSTLITLAWRDHERACEVAS
jgi:hypothetical protein